MKEPHGKGLANHSNPESCASRGNTAGEALSSGDTDLTILADGASSCNTLRGFVRLLLLVMLLAVAEPSGEEAGAEMREHQIADEGEDEHRDDVADEPLQP